MKKTLVALSVLAAASAQAGFEIYNQDGVTVNMGGDIEVRYVKAVTKDANPAQQIHDADLDFDVRYAVSDSLQVGGFWQFTDVGQTEGDAYVALYGDSFGSVKVGRLCTNLDDAGIGSDYVLGITSFFEDAELYCTDEVVRWDMDKGNFYASAALAQDMNGNNSDLQDSSTFVDAKAGYRVADFDFTAFYGQGSTSSAIEATLWSAQVRYNGIENLALAAAYYDLSGKPKAGGSKTDTDTIALAATYTIDKVVLAAGYSMSDANSAIYSGTDTDGNTVNQKDEDAWYVNAGYTIAPNTTIYAEVGSNDGYTETATNSGVYTKNETGYAVGVKAFF
ncbi:porin [Vibrio brasiliensis]|uniref:porin n=1 Tax=Vibrio brasiliensis TaxID=170652 RepID=UPI001EFDFA95|nr:porin [Vibrio brasiliensis]MCG9648733.1 porin [Vibrio brasiliensis]